MSEGHRGSLFWQRIASECCATFNKRENVVWGEGVVGGGALFLIRRASEVCVLMFGTVTPRLTPAELDDTTCVGG